MVWVGIITLISVIGISISVHSRLMRLRNRLAKGRKRLDDLAARRGSISSEGNPETLDTQIASSKAAFNDSVLLYNASIEVFPSNCIAALFRFTPAEPIA